MAVNTITKALKKLFKTITGQDPVSNNPTKLINELADNWSGGGSGGSGNGFDALITYSVDSPSQSSTFTLKQGSYEDVVAKVASGKPVNLAIAQFNVSGSNYGISGVFPLRCWCTNTGASEPTLMLHNNTICGSGWHLEWTSTGVVGALT